MAELTGIRAGKLAPATKPRSELSGRGYLVPVAGGVGWSAAGSHRDGSDRVLFSRFQQLPAFLKARPQAREAGRLGAFL